MGYWNYANIGASAEPENKELLEKIFDCVGFTEDPAWNDYDRCDFDEPDVYRCFYSEQRGRRKKKRAVRVLLDQFGAYGYMDLLYLLSALFPKIRLYYHSAEGNNNSDAWENIDDEYDTGNMTHSVSEKYTDRCGDGGPDGERSYKERFALEPPEIGHVRALADICGERGEDKLAGMLRELALKLENGQYVCKDDAADRRVIGRIYDRHGKVKHLPAERRITVKKADAEEFVIEDGILVRYNGKSENVTVPDGVTVIGEKAFAENGLSSVIIPEGVISIGKQAFAGCGLLSSVKLPAGLAEIGEEAFSGSWLLSSIIIPEGVISIGKQAFQGCSDLRSVTLPDSPVGIGEGAFSDCSLESILLPDGITDIADYAFCGCGMKSVKIPDSVIRIGKAAFIGCKEMVSVKIPAGVTSIGNEAFAYCRKLKSVKIPAGVTVIDNGTFSNCTKLKTAVIPAGVISIGIEAFGDCENLKSVTLPDGLTTVKSRAFTWCRNMESIIIPDSVTRIGEDVFKRCDSLTVYTRNPKVVRYCKNHGLNCVVNDGNEP